ncbi:lysylphosphatidylglycerol synthase domain-containing protein [Agromyces endophyticus]|uniref:lysylphosphatidylglycerol synthase domain-containing protein n=1 Tax=Agromyces sp. H17E-10 TaxID=2932244 RepID=UPI001FCF9A80|nr:lysylphosphatidylglycerol synthase domain-containing protein [Agromyces sp. H17E-10]UOQ89812.1 lysylphosphatidylglycerol synthase domain-containing protein [Agromyces sp. H17E-10]
MMARWSRRSRTVVRWTASIAIIAIVGYFFASALAANWEQVVELDIQFNAWSVGAIVLFAVAVPLSGLLWWQMLRMLTTTRVRVLEVVAVQCLSWILKYVPGQVGSVANKLVWAHGRGISKSLVAITFVYENAFLLTASIVPSVAILLASLGSQIFVDNATSLLLPLLVLIPFVVIANPRWFHWIVSQLIRRTLKREVPAEYFLSSRQGLLLQLEFFVPRALNGIGFLFVGASVLDLAPNTWLPLASAYVLAGAIGILAFFVPSGLGVREAVIVLIASQYMPTAQAVVLALLSRLFATAADALVAALYGILRLIDRKKGLSPQ